MKEEFRHGNISLEQRETITVEGEPIDKLDKQQLLVIINKLVRDIKKLKDA